MLLIMYVRSSWVMCAKCLSCYLGNCSLARQRHWHCKHRPLCCLVIDAAAAQEDQQQKAIGVVNVSLMKATPSIATAAACKPGTPFAMITNMAVCPELRRRGVSHMLMQAAVKAALIDLDISPPFALLLAYKYYEPAIRCVCV